MLSLFVKANSANAPDPLLKTAEADPFRLELDRPQVEAHELDPARRAAAVEPEVGQEVGREDRPVAQEAGGEVLARRIAVGERLERGLAVVAALADRRQEEALQHPRALRVGEVGAGDEHGIAAGRPGGERLRPRELLGRAVLDQADHARLVAVDLAPGAELVLGLVDPALTLGRLPARAGLPPHARAARRRRRVDGRAGQVVDGGHAQPASAAATSSMTIATAPGSRSIIDARYVRTDCSTAAATAGIDAPHSVTR